MTVNVVLGTPVVPADCSSHEVIQASELNHGLPRDREAEILGILKSILLSWGSWFGPVRPPAAVNVELPIRVSLVQGYRAAEA